MVLDKTKLGGLIWLAALAGPANTSRGVRPDDPIIPSPAELAVQDFGAVGDGTADDAAALQKAVNWGIGDVCLPKGTYCLSRPIVVKLDEVGPTSIRGLGVATIVMAGPGPALRVGGTHVKSADPQGVADRVWQRQRMPRIDGLAIVGRHEQAVGIEAVGTLQLTVTGTHIRQVRHAIHLVKNNRNVIVSDCLLRDDRPQATSVPLRITQCRDNTLVDHTLGTATEDSEEASEGP
jgi:hypothetical protein